jgi:hypothetical protein
MPQEYPPLPASPLKGPAPAKSGDKVYRKGEYADLQRSNKLQMNFERSESTRREAQKAPARESTFSRIRRGFSSLRKVSR